LDGAGWSAETPDLSFTPPALEEGSHTLQVREKDALGNWSPPGGYTVQIDLAKPTGAVVIDGGAEFSRFTDATLALLAEDRSGSGVAQMQFSNDGASWNDWEEFSPAKVWALSAGDGLKTVYVRFKDAAGNVSVADITDTIIVDTAPPTGTITINGGTDFCVTTNVGLALGSDDGSGSGAAQMQFSNDGSSWSGWETLDAGRTWSLSSGDELKTVHVQFKDAAGNVSAADIMDTITLDTTPPTGAVEINGGNDFCSTAGVTLTLTSEDGPGSGVAQMQFSDDGSNWSGWEIAAGTKSWTLPSGDGLKTVHVQFKDALGIISTAVISDEITLDSAPPTGTISIDGGALFCNTGSVALSLTSEDGSGSGVTRMQFSNDGSTWSGWEDAADTKIWTLAAGNGLKTVHAQFQDAAGNVSIGTISDTITLDPTALTAEMTPVTPTETCRDKVVFSVVFNKPVTPTFIPAAVSVIGLDGVADVTGTDPAYTVTVTLTNPDADGTVAIHVDNSVADLANNHFGGQTSPQFHVYNWHQPWFTQEPAMARKYVGDTQTFTAEANCSASSMAYQWQWTAAKTNGPTTPVWTLPSLATTDRGEYWCGATFDGTVHETGRVTLYVEDHVQITTEPEGAGVTTGQSYTFTVSATGGYAPLAYHWRKNGFDLPGATGTSYKMENLAAADAGVYSVEVSDANGDSIQSQDALLTVTQGMPVANMGGLLALASCMTLAMLRMRRRK
jgi:hypothetical protein